MAECNNLLKNKVHKLFSLSNNIQRYWTHGEGGGRKMKEVFLLKMKVIADTEGHKVVILGKGSDAAGGAVLQRSSQFVRAYTIYCWMMLYVPEVTVPCLLMICGMIR